MTTRGGCSVVAPASPSRSFTLLGVENVAPPSRLDAKYKLAVLPMVAVQTRATVRPAAASDGVELTAPSTPKVNTGVCAPRLPDCPPTPTATLPTVTSANRAGMARFERRLTSTLLN